VPSNRGNTTRGADVLTGMQETGIPPLVMAYGVIVALLLIGALLG
jgi:hypothetical protein